MPVAVELPESETAVESSVSFSQLMKKAVEPSGVASMKTAGLVPLGSGVLALRWRDWDGGRAGAAGVFAQVDLAGASGGEVGASPGLGDRVHRLGVVVASGAALSEAYSAVVPE